MSNLSDPIADFLTRLRNSATALKAETNAPYSKIKVEIGALAHSVLDRGQPLPAKAATVSRTRRELDVSIPLKTLGNPERLLISARTYFEDIPLDWVSWREVDLKSE